MTFKKKALLLCLCLFAFNTSISATELKWYDGKWAHENSDLKPDERVTFGKMKSGLRYAIIPNKLPNKRVSLYLNVQVGSLMEEDYERGFAHFVEHMGFNGSYNFPAGSLIPFFQENGMNFGGDTNAHTSLAETVYKINLAKVDNESLNTGLLILRDFADGMLMQDEEVKDEIGVILAEKNARESEMSLARKKRMELLYAGTKFSDDVIGTEEVIKSANRTNLTHFYKKWYRPESMMVIVVGDIDTEHIESMIKEKFKDIKNDTPKPTIKPFGEIKTPPLQVFFQKRPTGGLSFSITAMHPRVFHPDNSTNLREYFIDAIASYSFNQRLRESGLKNPTLWNYAAFQNSAKRGLIPSSNLVFMTNEKSWKSALNLVVNNLNSATKFGFNQDEIDQAKTIILRNLEASIQEESTRLNSDIAGAFASTANMGRVYTSADEDMRLFLKFSPLITLEEVNSAFRAAFLPKNRTIFVSGKANLTQEEIELAWEESQRQKTKKYESTKNRDFPYLDLPKEVEDLPTLSMKTLGQNGPKLFYGSFNDSLDIYLIPTKIEGNSVLATLVFGNNQPFGEKLLPLAKISSAVLKESGIGDLSQTDVATIFGGKSISISEIFTNDNSVISGSSSSNELTTLLQAMWTQYVDPSPKQFGYEKAKQALELNEYNKDHSVDGVDRAYSSSYFYGKSNRFALLDLKTFSNYTLDDVTAIVKNQRDFSGRAKIIITGDFDLSSTLKMATRLFGQKSDKVKNYDTNVIPSSFNTQKTTKREVEDKVDKSIFYKAFNINVEDINDRKTIVTRNMIATIFVDRMRKELREKLAIAYSPYANYRVSTNKLDRGYGIFTIKVDTQTKNVDTVARKIDEIIKELLEKGVSENELKRLKAPMITAWTTNNKRNILWHRIVQNEVIYNLPMVEWQNDFAKTLKEISVEDIEVQMKNIFTKSPTTNYIISSEGK